MAINYLHLVYLNKNMADIPNDIHSLLNSITVFVLNNTANEIKFKNILNDDTSKQDVFTSFKKRTKVDLNEDTYYEFMNKYYNVAFSKAYEKEIANLFKIANANTKDIVIPYTKKSGFLSKLFKKKEEDIKLESGLYNASMFNEIIESNFNNKDNEYAKELLKLNKFIIFKSDKYREIKNLYTSPDFIKEFIKVKKETETEAFNKLSDNDKMKKIRELFKNIYLKIEKENGI